VHADLARVEHLDAEDVEMLRRTGADDLGEARDTDPHQLTARALLGLLRSQRLVADLVHRLAERRVIVAAVVLPPHHRLVGELLRLDEVLHAQLGRIHLQLLREHVGDAFDRVHGLGDAERAPVRDPAWGLVRVDAVDLGERVREVVRTRADGEETGGEFGWIRGGVGVAVIGERLEC
jgi:hypothetical protein